MNEPEESGDEYARFESLAQQVVNTPKPTGESTDSAGEPADDDTERERAES